jgi:hypothetical protein
LAGGWWPLFFQGEGERPGEFSQEVFDEASRSSSEFYKLLRIQFPPTVETLTFLPTSTELSDAETVAIGAATKHEALDDPVDAPDESTTYVRNDMADTATEDRYGFDNLPADVVSVQEVRIFVRASTGFVSGDIEDDGPWAMALRVNGTNYFEDQSAPNRFFNIVFRTNLLRFALNPDTLAAWLPAEVDALQASLFTQPDGQGQFAGQRHTQLYMQVDVSKERRGQYSDSAANSRSEGLYLNRVLEWGTIRYSAEGWGIDRVSTAVRIADPDNELGALFSGKDGQEARGSLTDLRYASPNITDKTKWYTAFDGVLKSYEEIEPRIWELRFRTDDDGINSEIPRKKFTEFDFPNADASIFSKTIQVLYGVQDAFGLTNDGSVGCPDVDRIRFRRFVSLGIMKNVIRVFSKAGKDDLVILRTANFASGTSATAGYRVITPIINGWQFTLLEFNVVDTESHPALFEELTITCDVEGIEDIGDGTGILVRNADAIAHFISNFVKGTYESGNWLPTHPRIDVDSFAKVQTLLNNLGQDTSRRIGGTKRARKAKDELADWCFQLRIKMFWEPDGEIAVRSFSPFTLKVYTDEPWIREGLHDIEEPDYEVDDTEIIQQVFVSYIDRSASGDFLANIEVRDFTTDGDEAETIEATWFRSALPE